MGESHALLPRTAPGSLDDDLRRLLGVEPIRTSIADCELLGSLSAITSRGVLVGERLDPRELAELGRMGPVTELELRENAVGNTVLANDRGAVVHPSFSDDTLARVADALGVPARRGTVAGLGTVGMAAAATNRGVVVHPRTTEAEAKVIEEVLRVPVHRSTANFGVPVVGACLVANSRGVIAGVPTTPVEFVHLQEGFLVFD